MGEDRLIHSIGRLERSLERLEHAAASWQGSAPRADGDGAERELAAFGERHQRLKTRVERAIVALDDLIGRG